MENAEESVIQGIFRPDWLETLVSAYSSDIAKQFILHFNINDYSFDMSERKGKNRQGQALNVPQVPYTMREYLQLFLYNALGVQTIYSYSMANGASLSNPSTGEDNVPVSQRINNQAHSRFFEALKAVAGETLQQGGKQEQENPDLNYLKALGLLMRQSAGTGQSAPNNNGPIAVIIDYVEKLVPYQLGEGHGSRPQMQVMEIIQRWALDPSILQSKNINILLTTNIGLIPKSLYTEGSGCMAIRVPMPSSDERKAFISYLQKRPHIKLVKLVDFGNPNEELTQLSHLTQGMRLRDIENMNRRAYAAYPKGGPLLTTEDVQTEKSNVIAAQSEDLLEILDQDRSFDQIGGLLKIKKYLERKSTLMRNNPKSPQIPSALLLAGPPGTGKTILAEAMAKQSKFNLVKMKNIRDRWVGSSERNLDLVFNLLKDLYPVIVFVDEIDQAIGQRETGGSGDSGVSARMFGRILEEMGNFRNRGKILWIAATNRIDQLDDAMIRRFDRVVPLLRPETVESCRIFATILNMLKHQSEDTLKVSYGGDLDQSLPNESEEVKLRKFLRIASQTSQVGLTGSGIETIVRRAIELASEKSTEENLIIDSAILQEAFQDYWPNHDREMYDWQSLIALQSCNFVSVLPDIPKEGVFANILNQNNRIDPIRLQNEIDRLQKIIYARRRAYAF